MDMKRNHNNESSSLNMTRSQRARLLRSVAAAVSVMSGSVMAQSLLEEVVVTAQQRDQGLQDSESILHVEDLVDLEDLSNKNKDIEKIKKNDKNLESDVNLDILDEIDLDTFEDSETKTDTMSEINIKEPDEIYYEIYKNAILKANNLKKNTIEAFLNAKNIKLKYNLEDLDLDLEDNIDNNLQEMNYLK